MNSAPPTLLLCPSDRAVQSVIRLPLPIVAGNRDYRQREDELRRMDDLLIRSGVEAAFVEHSVMAEVAAVGADAKPLSDRRRSSVQRHARQALRCTVARILSSESHRSFSSHLAESPLLQWFCGIRFDGVIRVPSKTSLQRMEAEVSDEFLEKLQVLMLRRATMTDAEGASVLGLDEGVDLSVIWMDTTCAKLDIHYPTDWILLRDATRTIMRAIATIRSHGLRHRMPAPEQFIAQMNAQCMAMSAASRRGRGSDKKKSRKATLRTMKEIAGTVRRHGIRYRDLLRKSWRETDLSERQAQRIIDRLDSILTQLPAAITQAHERIIGERVVANDAKALSLYQPHAQVYVRGKSGADVEFGLQLQLSESADGLIVDCRLLEQVTHDSALLMPAITRMRTAFGDRAAGTVVTDRGFASAANDAALAKAAITNATLPRDPKALHAALQDPKIRHLQRRRAQTEARIGIFKANFLGDHLPTKSLPAQQRFVAWATLAHNLWVLARLDRAAKPLAQAG